MKSIILSVNPQEAVNILNGKQTIIIKKSAPKETPFKVYLYCTKDKRGKIGRPRHIENVAIWSKNFCPPGFISAGGKVVAEFVCDDKEPFKYQYDDYLPGYIYETFCLSDLHKNIFESACLTEEELAKYSQGKITYALRITELKVYDKPKELGEFKTVKFVRRYQRKNGTKFEKLQHSKRVEVKYITRPPQSWQYCEELR